jgi:hypothetical protein
LQLTPPLRLSRSTGIPALPPIVLRTRTIAVTAWLERCAEIGQKGPRHFGNKYRTAVFNPLELKFSSQALRGRSEACRIAATPRRSISGPPG